MRMDYPKNFFTDKNKPHLNISRVASDRGLAVVGMLLLCPIDAHHSANYQYMYLQTTF